MRYFNKEFHAQKLNEYYINTYGKKDSDFWYEQPAINVWVFGRDNKIITLKSHILTGEIEETIETKGE